IFYRMGQGWGRWTFILSCFLLVLVWLWDHRRRFPPWWSLVAAPLLMMLFLKLSHDRMFFRTWLEGGESYNVQRAVTASDWRVRWDTLDFANFDYVTYIVTHVPRHTKTWTYGTQYLQLFTEPIPRKLWKGKPIGPPVQLYNLNDYGNFIGLTPSIIGDGWQSGGWTGMFATLALVGGLLGFGYRWFTLNQDVVHKACAFLIINAMIIQLFRDGGISIFKFLLFSLVPLFVWQFLSNRLRLESQVGDERAALREARFDRYAGATPAIETGRADPAAYSDDEYDEEAGHEDDGYYAEKTDERDFEDEQVDEGDEDGYGGRGNRDPNQR
ncbi:MAG: O-antigen polymerase, partial [Opitutaceae bacterium]